MKNHKNNSLVLLSKVQEGHKAIIIHIKDEYVKNNLSKLGILINEEIYVSKIAPFGSPLSIRTQDAEIAIRKEIADLIDVQLV